MKTRWWILARCWEDREMAKGSGGIRSDGGKENIEAPYSEKRLERNKKDAEKLKQGGYDVEEMLNPNGAYLAIASGAKHYEHEIAVGHILAENGFAATLEAEGNMKIKLKDGRTVTAPAPDGKVEGFAHEISALNDKPSVKKVAEAIAHSYKPNKAGGKPVQADVAITITTEARGGLYNRSHINQGVAEFKRMVTEGETKAKPLAYLHVDEKSRKVYYRDVRVKK